MQKVFLFLSFILVTLNVFYGAYRPETTPAETFNSSVESATTISTSKCPDNPEELGAVCWNRQMDSATVQSKATGKPILILFQEVPGCSNCTRYGSSTLTHPLIVEAIEDLFVPLCVYNNKKGADAKVLEQYNEPAWNNPVVRIVNTDGKDLTQRMPDFRSQAAMVQGMTMALKAAGKTPPAYLDLLEEELSARERGLDTATFSMYCFWSGEGTFGEIPGVVETEPGFQDGKEVVKVVFDPSKVTRAELEQKTTPKGITACAKNTGFRIDKTPKYYLANTPWQYVPMTTLQACKANSLLGKGATPESVLSPRQIAVYQKLKERDNKRLSSAIGKKDLAKAWKAVE
jgi:hypothetical protein